VGVTHWKCVSPTNEESNIVPPVPHTTAALRQFQNGKVMIEKIIFIKNVGKFLNSAAVGDVTFKKLTLFFAENGCGKTTLCAILRSLKTGRHEYISERKTLGATNASSIQIRLAGNNHSFDNNVWSSVHEDIEIFDSVFIHDNVCAGDYVDHEHKKNLYRIIVGAQGVQFARQIKVLDGKIRDANAEIREKRNAVEKGLPSGVTIGNYLEWQPITNVNAEISSKQKAIANQKLLADKSSEIQARGTLSKIALPIFPSDFADVLSKQLSDANEEAESRVRQHIAEYKMGAHGEDWLTRGLRYVANDKCPFCELPIDEDGIIALYRAHFDKTYDALRDEVTHLGQRVTESIGDSRLTTIRQTLSSNLISIEFWKQFTEIVLPDIPSEVVENNYSALLEAALFLAQKKMQSPVDAISLDEDFEKALREVEELIQIASDYNSAVDIANSSINEQKTSSQQGNNASLFEAELSDLEMRKKRFEQDVVIACNDYKAATIAKTALEQQKTTTKEQLDQYCQQIILRYQDSINTYLDDFNTGFRIANSRHLYKGGAPSSQFQILINNNAVDLGDSRTLSGTPCFKTTLSSGDRSALALAFFLAAIEYDTAIGQKTIVLDDPFTSLDRFRRTCTQQLICQIAVSAKQVVVLSHDPHFLRLIFDGYPGTDIKVLQLFNTGNGSAVAECDIVAETQSTYILNYTTLLDFYRSRTGALLTVAKAIRPFLEGMLRSHFPGKFADNEWLGDFISKIRNASPTDGLFHAQADLQKIEAINDYSKKYHHVQNPSADSEPISPDELHGWVKQTLRLVGGAEV
jgi:wobble nucleotide-excising tRNase